MGLMDIVPAGVVTGDNLMKLMEYCRDNQVIKYSDPNLNSSF